MKRYYRIGGRAAISASETIPPTSPRSKASPQADKILAFIAPTGASSMSLTVTAWFRQATNSVWYKGESKSSSGDEPKILVFEARGVDAYITVDSLANVTSVNIDIVAEVTQDQ